MNDDHIAELAIGFVRDQATEAEVQEEEGPVYRPFAQSLRELVDLAVRTEVDVDSDVPPTPTGSRGSPGRSRLGDLRRTPLGRL